MRSRESLGVEFANAGLPSVLRVIISRTGELFMADVTIHESLWHDFKALAARQHRKPDQLVQQVLREYVQRVSDEDLLAASAHAARRSKFRMADTERVVRGYRKRAR